MASYLTHAFFVSHFQNESYIPYSAVWRPGALTGVFEVFGGAINRAGALIKTYENLDLRFPAHTRTLFIIYDN